MSGEPVEMSGGKYAKCVECGSVVVTSGFSRCRECLGEVTPVGVPQDEVPQIETLPAQIEGGRVTPDGLVVLTIETGDSFLYEVPLSPKSMRSIIAGAFPWIAAGARLPECEDPKDPLKGWLCVMPGRKFPVIVQARPSTWNKLGLEDGLAPKGHCSPEMWDGPRVLFWAEIPEPPSGG